VIDKDAAHQVRGDRKEVGAVLPLNPPLIDELQIRLVNQGGRRQRVIGPFALEIAARQPAQFRVNGVNETAPRSLVAFAPGHQETGYIRAALVHAPVIRPIRGQ
jgi:hypothetical protein